MKFICNKNVRVLKKEEYIKSDKSKGYRLTVFDYETGESRKCNVEIDIFRKYEEEKVYQIPFTISEYKEKVYISIK